MSYPYKKLVITNGIHIINLSNIKFIFCEIIYWNIYNYLMINDYNKYKNISNIKINMNYLICYCMILYSFIKVEIPKEFLSLDNILLSNSRFLMEPNLVIRLNILIYS